jgi:hypothetical protein
MSTNDRSSLSTHVLATVASLTATGCLVAVGAGAATAAKPPKPPKPPTGNGSPALSIDAAPTTLVVGSSSTLSGKLTGPRASGVVVRIEQDTTVPLGDSFVPTTQTATTAGNGTWTASVRPSVNTLYHAVAQTSPPTTSPVKRVNVRPLVRLSLSDATPARGSLVRFSGAVAPQHDGRRVLLQRRGTDGVFRTVVLARLRDAGSSRSVYARSLRIRSTGVYRAKIAQHADHTNGYSALRTITVHRP